MQLKAFFVSAIVATSTALANPLDKRTFFPSPHTVPGYPRGNYVCLTDDQAKFVANTFKSILTNPDRKAAADLSGKFLSDKYVETSDSINTLAGFPLGGPTFNGKQAFIEGVAGAPAIGAMEDLEILHTCNKVVWEWRVTGLGLDFLPVKGFNKITVDPATGHMSATDLEFNAIAWGVNTGWTCTSPQGQTLPASRRV